MLNENRCQAFLPGQGFRKYHNKSDEAADTEIQEWILFLCQEIGACQKQEERLLLLDFTSFQEESFSKLAHLDTTARSMEGEKQGFVQEKPLYCKQDKRGWRESLINV